MFFKKEDNKELENLVHSLNNLYHSVIHPMNEMVVQIAADIEKQNDKDSFNYQTYSIIEQQMQTLTKSITTLCDQMEDFATSHKNFFTKFHEILDNLKVRKQKEEVTKPRVKPGRKPKRL